jgi:ABC-2 type transport system ATP-binding protein
MTTHDVQLHDPILIVDGLRKYYGELHAVNDISFTVKRQEIFGILGPNGAGKTTTLEMIETLRDADLGQVILNGVNIRTSPMDVKRMIGVQLQSTSFFDRLTLRELLVLFGDFYGRKIDPVRYLEEVDLADRASSYPAQLSGGQKQRFSVALALVNDPAVLFLDEPTTGLDPQARRHLWGVIQRIRSEGKTIVLTTHYMEEAEELCDRVAIMDRGRIIALDSPRVLIQRLVDSGFSRERAHALANLEDVFLSLTGHSLREDE